ncbi:MAG: C25 family cysteine peptidase, partial [Candidatus Fermentibacteraceae bacterium]
MAGEMRLCEQRILLVDVFPARFLASADSLRLASGLSVSVRFDSSEAVWSDVGLGVLQSTARDSWIVGYHPVQPPQVPVPTVFRDFDLQAGPPRVPDYVILVADGLDGPHIDSLAWHRVGLNGMDAAVVTTGEVMDEFGGGGRELTADIIRDFTETMWTWGQPAAKRPSYLLLAGDHGGPDYAGEGWFLPTHEYADDPGSLPENMYANDEWYAYFDCPGEVPDNDFPDMMVGRLSVVGADTLQAMIDDIIACEEPVVSQPVVDRRRRVVRLAGTGDDVAETTWEQTYHEWHPNAEWTRNLCGWLNYEFSNAYCGDGRDWTSMDGSVYSSAEYRDFCIDRFSEGAGVIFYSDHGDCHMFSAGLEWWPDSCDYTKGARDSTFNCLRAQELTPSQYHTPPFVLMLCCGAGTFNHTRELHPEGNPWPVLCKEDDPPTFPPYDFSTRCLAEAVHRNTSCPSAGVFAGSGSSSIFCYGPYAKGVMEAVWRFGESRLGEAIAGARARRYSSLLSAKGLGQFNLLGDPALDIGDRVRYPDKCDLVIAPGDIVPSDYPRLAGDVMEEDISFTVRNNGAAASGPFDITVSVTYDGGMDTYQLSSPGLDAGEEAAYTQTWSTTSFDPPGTVTVYAHADPDGDCDDSRAANNDATMEQDLWDVYPLEDGWPLQAGGVISQPPMLVDLDDDPDLEVVVVAGDMLEAYQPDGSLLWRNEQAALSSSAAPLAADLDGDGDKELVAVNSFELFVFDIDGDVLGSLDIPEYCRLAVADMHPAAGLELVIGEGGMLRLYSWDRSGGRFEQIDWKRYSYNETPLAESMAC